MSEPADAPVILCDEPGSFARSVLAERHPALIEKVRDAFPYGPEQHRALDALLQTDAEGVINPLDAGAHDHDRWQTWGARVLRPLVVRGALPLGRELLLPPPPRGRRLLHPRPLAGHRPVPALQTGRTGHPRDRRGTDRSRPPPGRPADEQPGRAAARLALGQPRGPRLPALPGGAAGVGRRTAGGRRLGRPVAAAARRGPGHAVPGRRQRGPRTPPRPASSSTICSATGAPSGSSSRSKPYPYYVSDATTSDVVDCLRHLAARPGRRGRRRARLWAAMADGRLDRPGPRLLLRAAAVRRDARRSAARSSRTPRSPC